MVKYTKAQARYELFSKTKKCINCYYFIKTDNTCMKVQGKISRNATCSFWRKF